MKIFLSAVSGQFKACRDALRSDLSAVGAEVVVQEDFQQHGASLLEKLEHYIGSCDRIIALVGYAYGFEPEETMRPIGQPRRSYTQWEYLFAMGERLDGSRQPPKDVYLYFGSPEFLAMHPVSQEADATQLQQEFSKELRRSGKDRNQFGSLHELRALVLRDGFRLERLETVAPTDLASDQATPALATQRLTIREKSATEIIRYLKENTPSYRFHEKAKELYLGRWTREPGWQATVDDLPSKLSGGSWNCCFKEVGSGTLIMARTSLDISTLCPGDSVIVSGRISDVSLLEFVSLEEAIVRGDNGERQKIGGHR
jgi:Domain of unknown function (DUF4062)